MPMKRTKYIIIHSIQTAIYLLLTILMTIIKPQNKTDNVFMAFYGFLVVVSLVCIFVLIMSIFWSGSDDEE